MIGRLLDDFDERIAKLEKHHGHGDQQGEP
jgi:hypothetical protein